MSYKLNRILCSVGMRGDCSNLVKESMKLALITGADLHILHVVRAFSKDLLSTLRSNIHNPQRLTALLNERTQQWNDELKSFLNSSGYASQTLRKRCKVAMLRYQ